MLILTAMVVTRVDATTMSATRATISKDRIRTVAVAIIIKTMEVACAITAILAIIIVIIVKGITTTAKIIKRGDRQGRDRLQMTSDVETDRFFTVFLLLKKNLF